MTPSQARAYLTSVIQDRTGHLGSFHHRLEDWLAREIKELQQHAARLDRLPAEKRSVLAEFYSDEQSTLGTVFTTTLRYSVLATAHTLLESSLNAICAAEKKRYGHRLGLTDVAGQGIARARLYLTKVCGVRFPDATAAWNRMAILADLRNVIAHANGDVSNVKREEKVRNIVKNTPGLKLRNGRYLEVSDDFVRDTLSKMGDFFSEVHRAFPAKLRAS